MMHWSIPYFQSRKTKKYYFNIKKIKEIIKIVYLFCTTNNLVWLEWMRDFHGGICYFDRPSAHWRTTLQQGLGGHWQTYWRMTTASTGSGWRQLIVWPRSTSKNLLSPTLPFFEESNLAALREKKRGKNLENLS